MKDEATAYLELIERRTALLQSLSDALRAARTAMIVFDVDGLESRVAQQQSLCGDLQEVDRQIEHLKARGELQRKLETLPVGKSQNALLGQSLSRLQEVQSSVKRLNDEHQLMLQRSQRTVSALLNSLRRFTCSYHQDALLQVPRTPELQEHV